MQFVLAQDKLTINFQGESISNQSYQQPASRKCPYCRRFSYDDGLTWRAPKFPGEREITSDLCPDCAEVLLG